MNPESPLPPAKPAAEKNDGPPVLLARWYDHAKWLLERVDDFPKNQRFIFGTRIADEALGILELLVEAAYSRTKGELLRRANLRLEVLRWLMRMAHDRKILTGRQYEYSAEQITTCGKMLGGWRKQAAGREGAA